jgi:flagellar hook-length control protein FliK
MSPFDLSFMSVPPEGGTDALAASAAATPKDEASSDAFARLLAQLSGLSDEDLALSAVSEVPVEDLELATEALSTSPDGWEDTRLEPDSKSVEDDADESTPPLVLTGFLMSLPVSEEADRPSKGNQSIEETGSTTLSAAGSASDGLPEVFAKNATDSTPSEATQPADAETLESMPQLAGRTPAASSREVPIGKASQHQFQGSVSQAEDSVRQVEASGVDKATANAQASVANAASRADATPREGRSETPGATRQHDNTRDSARITNTPPVNVQEIAASLERRAASEGESQPDLAAKIPTVSTGSGGHPQQVVQTFQQAVAAALHETAGAAAPTPPPSDPGGLDNQIVQGIRRLWRDGTEEIRVTLRPDYLGALTISLKVDQNVVSAVLHVDEPQVRAWVQAHEAQLRQAMTSQGLSLEQLVITDEKPGKENRGRDTEARQNRHPNAGRPDDEPAPVFEVAV